MTSQSTAKPQKSGMAVVTEIPSNAEYAVGLGTLGIYLGN